jgi:RNA polymerase sigma factor (sigma-70 family)
MNFNIPQCIVDNNANKFINEYEKIIYSVCRKYLNYNCNNFDYILEENYYYVLGELSINNFEKLKQYNSRVRFTTFLCKLVINILIDKNKSELKGKRIPQFKELKKLDYIKDKIFQLHFDNDISDIRFKISQESNRIFSQEEIIEILNKIYSRLSSSQLNKINRIILLRQGIISIDYIKTDLSSEKYQPEKILITKENNELLKNIFEKANLSIEEKNIIVYFYLDNLSAKEIVVLLYKKYSEQEIYNIKNAVMKKLREVGKDYC